MQTRLWRALSRLYRRRFLRVNDPCTFAEQCATVSFSRKRAKFCCHFDKKCEMLQHFASFVLILLIEFGPLRLRCASTARSSTRSRRSPRTTSPPRQRSASERRMETSSSPKMATCRIDASKDEFSTHF